MPCSESSHTDNDSDVSSLKLTPESTDNRREVADQSAIDQAPLLPDRAIDQSPLPIAQPVIPWQPDLTPSQVVAGDVPGLAQSNGSKQTSNQGNHGSGGGNQVDSGVSLGTGARPKKPTAPPRAKTRKTVRNSEGGCRTVWCVQLGSTLSFLKVHLSKPTGWDPRWIPSVLIW